MGLAIATSDGQRPVRPAELAAWKRPLHVLHAAALHHLKVDSPASGWRPIDDIPGLRAYLAPDGFASARLLVLDRLVQPFPIEGVLAAVPTPDTLWVVSLADPDGLKALQALPAAMQFAYTRAAQPLSDQLYWLRDGTWQRIDVAFAANSVELSPPEGFVEALERAVAVAVAQRAGDAEA